MIRVAVFDLDGTLVDSRRDLADATNALLVELGGEPLAVDVAAAMVGEGAGVLVRRALAASGLPPDTPGALERFLELYDDRLVAHTRPYPGIVDALVRLEKAMPLAVLTNKPGRATERLLEALALRRFFHQIIGGDSRFGRKPNPSGLRHIIASAGAAAGEAALVGDSIVDFETARGAGTRVCIAAYGFGYPSVRERVTGDVMLAKSVQEVATLLLGEPAGPGRTATAFARMSEQKARRSGVVTGDERDQETSRETNAIRGNQPLPGNLPADAQHPGEREPLKRGVRGAQEGSP